MPRIVPVSDFRADVRTVADHTDRGEVVIITQNGRPRRALIDCDEWNASAQAQERACAKALQETEGRELSGELGRLDEAEFRSRMQGRREQRR
jgi:prevent-host-death family protein